MRKQIAKICQWGTVAVMVGILPGAVGFAQHEGVVQTYHKATARFDDKKVDTVKALTEKTVQVQDNYQGGTFRTEARKAKIHRYRCSRCHTGKETDSTGTGTAHADIIIHHGNAENRLSCFTCHREDARDFLIYRDNVKVDMDHSYQLCGRCHFREKKDWVGGAHGKRISFWAGQRVVKNCTSCHNPHSPRFEKRWPATYSPPLGK